MRKAVLGLLCLVGFAPLAAGEGGTPLNRAFRGRIVAVAGNRVTFAYDFEDRAQLEDFEAVALPGLLAAKPTQPTIEDGKLVLRGSCALRHRAVAAGAATARLLVRMEKKSNVGTLFLSPDPAGPFRITNLFDYRLRKDGALHVLAVDPPGPTPRGRSEPQLEGRPVAGAAAESVGKRVALSEDVEVEVFKQGWREGCRVGTLHCTGTSEGIGAAMPAFQFGVFVHESEARFDDLLLTVELSDEYAAAAGLAVTIAEPAHVAGAKAGALVKMARDAPLSDEAAAARRELARQGPDGWNRLAALARQLARKQPYAVAPIVAAIGAGPEEERRAVLRELYQKIKNDEVRFAIAATLAPGYPQDEALLRECLALRLPGRAALFRELVRRGLPDDAVRDLATDTELADEALSILQDRAASLAGISVEKLAVIRAREAEVPAAALEFRLRFAENPDWKLVSELIKLLDGQDEEVAHGAHILLMTISGKEIARDKDLWRSWVAAKQSGYEAPDLGDPGLVAAAVHRGCDFLRRDLLEDGACVWPTSPDWPGCRIGATALAVEALKVGGVASNDEAIVKALRTTLLRWSGDQPALRDDMERYNYALCMLTLALQHTDAPRFKPLLEILAKRLIAGQLENGQWTYYDHDVAGYAGARRPTAGDNSNTQYAILALRAARRAGVEIDPEVFKRTAAWFRSSVNHMGGWGYGGRNTNLHELSMTAAGIATLSICAEAVFGEEAGVYLRHEQKVTIGHRRLGELLLTKGYEGEELYAMYGVERACVLTGVRSFNDFNWYREGARLLVKSQKENGAWGNPNARGVTTGAGYGEAIDTAYAILFLKLSTTAVPGAGEGGQVKIPTIRKG